MLSFPKVRVAAIQAAPVYLQVDATVDKVCELIREAATNGAQLIAFPEVFIPGYPYWNWLLNPIQGSPWFDRLYRNSIEVPGPETERIAETARECGCFVVIGCNERIARSIGTLYNTNLIFGADGKLLGRHRKLVPTWAEKLTWTGGDGSSLRIYDTPVGKLGTLACGENTNTLARFALLSQGEQIHVANYISLPVAPESYNMLEAIKIRAAAHSFEGKIFTIVSCSTISQEIIDMMCDANSEARSLLGRRNSAFSGIIGPDGCLIGDSLADDEGICYADIALDACIQPKQMHDIVGSYNRFDIFNLTVNRARLDPVSFVQGSQQDEPALPLNATDSST
ncbi:MAG: carbon-nitrogen hydrolase family protein [Steroidobacteraceae bacterium]